MEKLDLMAFTDPRHRTEFDDWPSGKHRVKCRFYTEHDAKRGFRVCRQTQGLANQRLRVRLSPRPFAERMVRWAFP